MDILYRDCDSGSMNKQEWELDQLLNLEIDLAYEREADK
jgi:hypothetical protein